MWKSASVCVCVFAVSNLCCAHIVEITIIGATIDRFPSVQWLKLNRLECWLLVIHISIVYLSRSKRKILKRMFGRFYVRFFLLSLVESLCILEAYPFRSYVERIFEAILCATLSPYNGPLLTLACYGFAVDWVEIFSFLLSISYFVIWGWSGAA